MKMRIRFFGRTVNTLETNHQITETIEIENTEQKTLFLALHKKGYEMMHWIELEHIKKKDYTKADKILPEDLEATAEFYDKHMDAQKIFQEGARILFWTKKLGDIHIEIVPRSPNETAGLCGAPLLGNDYFMGGKYKNIDSSMKTERKVCIKCALALQKRLSEIHDKIEETKDDKQ